MLTIEVNLETEADARRHALLATLHDQFANQVNCDVLLLCEERSVSCHRLVLETFSTYFKQLFAFRSAYRADASLPIELVVFGLDFEHIQLLLEAIYYGKVKVAGHQLNKFTKAAKMFGIKHLISGYFQSVDDLIDVTEVQGLKRQPCCGVKTPKASSKQKSYPWVMLSVKGAQNKAKFPSMSGSKGQKRMRTVEDDEPQAKRKSCSPPLIPSQPEGEACHVHPDIYIKQEPKEMSPDVMSPIVVDDSVSSDGFQNMKQRLFQEHANESNATDGEISERSIEEQLRSAVKANGPFNLEPFDYSGYKSGGKWLCPECDKKATSEKALHEHVRVVHKNKFLSCAFCVKQFSLTRNLKSHYKKAHSMTLPRNW